MIRTDALLSLRLALCLCLVGACAKTSSEWPTEPDLAMSVVPPPDPPISDPDALLRAGCAVATGMADRIPLYLLFVLDGSGSMRNNGKWAAAVPALSAILDDLAASADPSLGVGLTVFADKKDLTIGDTTAGPYDKMDVKVAYMDTEQLGRLKQRLSGTSPNLGTPTYEVLSGQYPLLRSFVPDKPLLSGGRRVLVFMTDGVPDPDMPAGLNEVPWSLALAKENSSRMGNDAVRTFSVGVGPFPSPNLFGYSPLFLGDLAVAGGTRASASCDPHEERQIENLCYFQVTPPPAGTPTPEEIQQLTARFVSTINTVRTRATPCEYSLEQINRDQGQIDPSVVNVIFQSSSGMRSLLPRSESNGWTYDNPTRPTQVLLHGPTCDLIRTDRRGVLTIVLGCQTILK